MALPGPSSTNKIFGSRINAGPASVRKYLVSMLDPTTCSGKTP